jgi:hypothetical protein
MITAQQQPGPAPTDAISTRVVRALLAGEALTFALASLVHRGLLIDGYGHRQAYIAESIIAAVLAAGVVTAALWPRRAASAAVAAQGLALVGTAMGLIAIAVGVGPRTVPDVVYHAAIVAVLVGGLRYAVRGRHALRSRVSPTTRPPYPDADRVRNTASGR